MILALDSALKIALSVQTLQLKERIFLSVADLGQYSSGVIVSAKWIVLSAVFCRHDFQFVD